MAHRNVRVYSLKLEFIFSWYRYTRMALPTAIGFAVISVGWWAIWANSSWYQQFYDGKEDKKIILITGAILLCLTMISGLGSIAGLTYFNVVSINSALERLLQQKANVFINEVNQAEKQSVLVANNPVLIAQLNANEMSKDILKPIKVKFSSMRLDDPQGNILASSGKISSSPLVVPLTCYKMSVFFGKMDIGYDVRFLFMMQNLICT